MLLGGANTYEGTQIKDNQSKYNLNCYNAEGVLTGYNYKIDFDVKPLKLYEREYTNLDIGSPTTSLDVSKFELSFTQDQVEYPSGIVKPSCTLFVDTTKFDSGEDSNYIRKMTELNESYFVGDRNPIVADKLLEAVSNFGKSCEVYTNVEIAVSFSGAYGESGLTKFRLTSSILHFFVVVDDVFKYINNPNYKYLNIYIKYASYETLVLINKIELTDLQDATGSSINLAEDASDRTFYTCYTKDTIRGITGNDDGEFIIALPDTNKLVPTNGSAAIIYSGLFQFADEARANASWFISSKVTAITPLVDVETHTYLSTEDYDIERNVNEYLDDAYNLVDNRVDLSDKVPYITADINIQNFIDNSSGIDNLFGLGGDYKLGDFHQLKFSNRKWANNQPLIASHKKTDIDLDYTKSSNIYGGMLYGIFTQGDIPPPTIRKVSDLYDSTVNYGNVTGGVKHSDTGTFYIQYYSKSLTDGSRQMIKSTNVSFTSTKYFTLSFSDIVDKKVAGFTWQIEIWCTFGTEDAPTNIFRRILALDVDYAVKVYGDLMIAAGDSLRYSTLDSENDLMKGSIYRASSNIGTVIDTTSLPLRDYGVVKYTESGKTGIFVVLNPGTLMAKPDQYHTGMYDARIVAPEDLNHQDNFTDDIANIEYNLESRGNDDYSSYAEGITNSPENKTPDWRVNVRHTEEYDGRLFMSTIDKVVVDDSDYSVLGVVASADDIVDPVVGSSYCISDGINPDYVIDVVSIEPLTYNSTAPETEQIMYQLPSEDTDGVWYTYNLVAGANIEKFILDIVSTDSKDLYYSEQTFPEVVLESNYKGYNNHITGLYEFIEQLYVFQNTQIDLVRKNLTREVAGIIEPTYQFHKSFDKGAIEWTIKEYEKRLFFTNNDGVYYIDADGNYNKVSGDINRLFTEKLISTDTVDYAEIKGEFYVVKLRTKLEFKNFSGIKLYYADYRALAVQYIAYNIETATWWFGNDETADKMWFYLTKDFTQRNQYENQFKKKQLKRISVAYDSGILKVNQIKNANALVGRGFWYKENTKGRPIRHTLKGVRGFTYSFLISSEFKTKIVDFSLIENGK